MTVHQLRWFRGQLQQLMHVNPDRWVDVPSVMHDERVPETGTERRFNPLFTLNDVTTVMGDVVACMEVEGFAPDARHLREFVDRVAEALKKRTQVDMHLEHYVGSVLLRDITDSGDSLTREAEQLTPEDSGLVPSDYVGDWHQNT